MVPAGNKAKRLSPVNHTTKTIHHHHHRRVSTEYSSTIVSNVFLLKLGWTELKRGLKGCQFLNGLQLKNDKKNNLRTSKLNKDL